MPTRDRWDEASMATKKWEGHYLDVAWTHGICLLNVKGCLL